MDQVISPPPSKTLYPNISSVKSEDALLQHCKTLEGLSFLQLAKLLQITVPTNIATKRKGWMGRALELALGANANNTSMPDFTHLGIELKTLPVNREGNSAESTFITSIPLLSIYKQQWLTSSCYAKLKRVLWIPIEAERSIAFEQRRIGRGFLWSPSKEEAEILRHDWEELVFMLSSGHLAAVDAKIGQYLQVRPKAANGKSLCYGFDEQGNKILTLPRGFYLRSSFTSKLIQRVFF